MPIIEYSIIIFDGCGVMGDQWNLFLYIGCIRDIAGLLVWFWVRFWVCLVDFGVIWVSEAGRGLVW